MYISTYSGRQINLLDPQPDQFCIEDIAHALSMQCRFAGNCSSFYSVAQHCVIVSTLVPEEYALPALAHDFGELIGDIASPIKALVPQIKEIEDRIMEAIAIRFGISFDHYDVIKHADLVAMATEKRDLMKNSPEPWDILKGIEPAPFRIFPMPQPAAKRALLQRFNELTARQAGYG